MAALYKNRPRRVSGWNGFSQGSWASEDKDSSVSACGTDTREGSSLKWMGRASGLGVWPEFQRLSPQHCPVHLKSVNQTH